MFDPTDYGGRDTPYAAQTMFGSHRVGMDFGGLGNTDLGYVTDINSSEDQTFDPNAMGYLDAASDVPAVGNSFSNMMPTMGAVANPSPQTTMPRAAPERPTVIALDPYIHQRQQQARRNTDAADASAAPADAGAGIASAVAGAVGAVTGLFGSIVGLVAQNKMIKTQSAMAAQDAQTQLQLAQAQIQVAAQQSEAAKAQALAAAYGQSSSGTPWGLILAGVGGVAVLGMVYAVSHKKKKKKSSSGA